MFNVTTNERKVLFFLALVLFFGSILSYLLKKYPYLHDIVNVIDSERIYTKIDINLAGEEQLQGIPFIGEYTARQIILFREEHGPFMHIEQLKQVKGIREDNYTKFSMYLKVDQHGQ